MAPLSMLWLMRTSTAAARSGIGPVCDHPAGTKSCPLTVTAAAAVTGTSALAMAAALMHLDNVILQHQKVLAAPPMAAVMVVVLAVLTLLVVVMVHCQGSTNSGRVTGAAVRVGVVAVFIEATATACTSGTRWEVSGLQAWGMLCFQELQVKAGRWGSEMQCTMVCLAAAAAAAAREVVTPHQDLEMQYSRGHPVMGAVAAAVVLVVKVGQ